MGGLSGPSFFVGGVMGIDESNIKPLPYKEAMQSIKNKLSESEIERFSQWWSGMSYLERVSIIGCSMIFANVANSRAEIRKIACYEWSNICVTSQLKIVATIKKISSRAKSYGVCFV